MNPYLPNDRQEVGNEPLDNMEVLDEPLTSEHLDKCNGCALCED